MSYTVRFELVEDRPPRPARQDLVCWLVVDRADYVEIYRAPHACVDGPELCREQIDAAMRAAEDDFGSPLPWAFDDTVAECGRLAFTGDVTPLRNISVIP